MTTKLTPATARAAQPGDLLHDHEVVGLQLRVTRERSSWYLYYRTRDKRQRKPKLGDFPEMSLARAREIARGLKQRVAAGEDPSGHWKTLRQAPTVADLAAEYIERHARPNKAPKSVREDQAMLRVHILPGLGAMRVDDVTADDVERFLADVNARRYAAPNPRHAGKRDAPVMANQCRALLQTMFNLAADRYGLRTKALGNPVDGVKRYRVDKRRRLAGPDELQRLATMIRELHEETPAHAAALVTLFVTGARPSEIEQAKRSAYAPGRITLTEHKTFRTIGAKVIPLPPIADALISRIAPPASEPNARLFGRIALRRIWERLREAAGCPDLQLRDLRRTFASYALGQVPLDAIGSLFGHTNVQTTRGYAWLMDDARQASALAGAAAVSRAAGGFLPAPVSSASPGLRTALRRRAMPPGRGHLARRQGRP